ncbi:MAG: uracil-DNA glycosylase [Verrucomicrobiales bacterium]|jgi:DNA polymerase|nr:uracil-DNA glycosylase [Verrucomicrobiales bacterium]
MNQQLENATVDYLRTLRDLGAQTVEVSAATLDALKSRRKKSPPPVSRAAAAAADAERRESRRPATVSAAAPVAVPAAAGDAPPLNLDSAQKAAALEQLAATISANAEYRAMFKYAKNMVFGVGAPDAQIMFIGEAPGADEDAQGEPFVGRAGQLLTKMIQAMGLQRADVYIGNILKYRPDMPPGSSGNRKPTMDEIAVSRPYICEQVRIIRPRALVALGNTAVEGLFKTGRAAITQRRGQWTEFQGIPLMPTYHPAYLLRNPVNSEKRKVWEDLLQVMARVGFTVSDKQRRYFLTK